MLVEFLFRAMSIGIIATLAIDIWAFIAKRYLRLPTASWDQVGRWVGHIFRGRLRHEAISKSPPIGNELSIGWAVHYLTGIAYGMAYLFIVQVLLHREPSLLSALAFGLATLVAPWLVMQPAMGAGVFARRTPHPRRTRLVNLSMHAMFGVALYAGWILIR